MLSHLRYTLWRTEIFRAGVIGRRNGPSGLREDDGDDDESLVWLIGAYYACWQHNCGSKVRYAGYGRC